MNFDQLVRTAAELHCFSAGMITAGQNIDHLRVQLSRWVSRGKVLRIHKGWYTLGEPYRRVRVDTSVLACVIRPGSYVSLQWALAYHGMIPEFVPETTSVTTGRPATIESPFGRIHYRHVKHAVFFGYAREQRGVQQAFIASPEKALLDLLYLTPGSEDQAYISSLRLQQTDSLDMNLLRTMAARYGAPRLERAVPLIERERRTEG